MITLNIIVKEFIYEKERLELKLRRKYVLDLLNELQHFAKIKLRNFLNFQEKGSQIYANESSKTTKTLRKLKVRVHVSFPMSGLEFFNVIG